MNSGKGGNTAARVTDMALPIAEELGLSLWDVCFEKEGANWYLRVFIDRSDRAVDINDCESMTRPLSKLLDDTDPIDMSYILEVGSVGSERILKKEEHYNKCMGEKAVVRLIRPADGRRELFGTLKSYSKTAVTIEAEDGSEHEILLADAAFVKAYCGDGFIFGGYDADGLYKVDYDFSEKD